MLLLVCMFLPRSAKPRIYSRIFGWEIHETSRIGLTFIDADVVKLGPNTRIGHLNRISGVREFIMEEDSFMLNLNEFAGETSLPQFNDRSVQIGRDSRIMSRHFFDVSGRVEIGDACNIGGRGTQVWSHSRFYIDGEPSLEPRVMRIDDQVYVGARSILIHCTIPARSTVAAGSVLSRSFEQHESGRVIIGGNPASLIKRIPSEGEDSGSPKAP